jgi:signal transduction histidine kinase
MPLRQTDGNLPVYLTAGLTTYLIIWSVFDLRLGLDILDQPIVGDSIRSRRVTTNFLGNMIEFTPSRINSKSYVALSIRLLTLDDSNVALEFSVLDTGIGIAKDKLIHTFGMFCQADGPITTLSDFSLIHFCVTR